MRSHLGRWSMPAMVVTAVLAAALAAPSTAFAARAVFSQKAPAAGSKTLDATPKISVYVVDKYGIKGAASFTLTIDGKATKEKITYKKSGDYKRMTVSFQVATSLTVGVHKVLLKVKNIKKQTSSATWSFTVLPPPVPLTMPLSIPADACPTCHQGYPALHPMTACGSCHGENGPVPRSSVNAATQSPHTLECSLETPCHGGGGQFPHVLGTDCTSCHGDATTGFASPYPDTPSAHGAYPGDVHTSTSTGCAATGCHDLSLTVEHYRYTIDGARFSCETCHASTDPRVVAALGAGSTACGDCHDLSTISHGTSTSYGHTSTIATQTLSGTVSGVPVSGVPCSLCHQQADISAVHGNRCATCHPTPRSTFGAWNRTCVQGGCHAAASSAPMHAGMTGDHAFAAVSCVQAGCHTGGTDAAAVHMAVPNRTDSGCGICHDAGSTPTVQCATCHGAGDGHPAHPSSPAPQTIAINGVGYGVHACSECHASDLRDLHGGTAGCQKCHPDRVAGLAGGYAGGCVQGGCHTVTSGAPMHAALNAAHTLSAVPTCIGSACHSGGADVAKIHAAPGGPGCAACHGGGTTPTLVCSSTGCHPAGAPADHDAHPATVTSGTISINSVSYGKHACSECHASLDLQVAHGENGTKNSCVKCHPSPADSIPTWNGTCAQGDCHAGASTLPQHGGIDAAHTLSSAPSCVGSGCHTGGTDVAAIHATHGGCAACHGIGKTPTLVCAATGCHPTGAPANHSSHPATVTTGTITINSVGYGVHLCSECHATTELQAAHGGAASCSKCHPSPRNSFTSWNHGCVQGGCHSSGALTMHGSVDAAHIATAAPSCTVAGCHAGGSDVAAIHATHGGCAACHGAGKTPTLVCAASGCHPNGPPANHDSHPATVTTGTITINSVGYGVHLCSECHATTELQAAHGGAASCSKCHPAPRGSFTTWNGTCTQGNCHAGTSSIPQHGGINAAHTLTSTPSCVGAGCHTGGTDVAKIHGVSGGPGCAGCHGAGRTPSLVCSSAGCHPDDVTAKHGSHPATVTTGTITINSVGYGVHLCSECHLTTELQAVHGENGTDNSCAKCHPTPRTSFTSWNGSCAQGNCHAGTSTLPQHGTINVAHTLGSVPTCVGTGCHTGGTDVAAIHATHGGCAACHGGGKTPTLVCANDGCHPTGAPSTHTSHPATVTTGTIAINGVGYGVHLCSECHAVTELQAAHGGASSCSKCHPSPRNSFTKWNGACAQGNCHAGTSTIPQHGGINAAHTLGVASSCTAVGCHAGGTDVAAIHAVAGGPGCAACHGTGKTPSLVCAAIGCHPGDVTAKHASHPATVTTGTISINGTGYGVHLCSECHAVTELQAAHGGATSCSKCHPAPRNSFATWNGTCAQGNCHAGSSPLPQHGGINAAHTLTYTPTCVGAGCHTGGTDVAAIHAAHGGCAACHGSGKTPSLVCANIGCHPTGAPANHSSHPSTVATGFIAINGTPYGIHACSECHATTELQAAHGGASSCSKCHPTPRDSFTTWNGTCAQGNCHAGTSTIPQHGKINTGHTLSGPNSCIADGCHSGGTDVAKIHATHGGCVACHNSRTPLTLVCTTCHPGDLTAVHRNYVGSSHVVPAGSCVTSVCHSSGDAALIHAPGLGCVDCHGTGKTPSLTCATCHPGDVTVVHAAAIGTKHTVTGSGCVNSTCHTSGDAALLHAPGQGCVDCHADGTTASLQCSDCHPAGIAADHTTGTAAHTVNTHPCISSNCHVANAATVHEPSEDGCAVCHASGTATTSTCTSCHSLSWAAPHTAYSMTDYHGAVSGTGETDSGLWSDGWLLPPYARGQSLPCSTCHVPTGTTNPLNFPTTLNGHAVTVTDGYDLVNLCSACHGGTIDQWHAGCFWCHSDGGMGGGDGPQTMVGSDCADCHDHGGQGWPHGIGHMTGPTL